MDDPRDLVLVERPLEPGQIGDVAADHIDLGGIGAEDEVEPVGGVAEVEADHLDTAVEEGPGGPGAQAAEDAGDERALSQAARPGTR